MEITGCWKNDTISFWENNVVLEIGTVLELFQACKKIGPLWPAILGEWCQVMGLPNHWALGPNLIWPGKASRNPKDKIRSYPQFKLWIELLETLFDKIRSYPLLENRIRFESQLSDNRDRVGISINRNPEAIGQPSLLRIPHGN